jgi:allantoate deiminase
MDVRGDRIQNDIERINSFNATPEKGVTRLTFSPEYEGARAYVLQEMKKIGARVSITQAGNMRGRLEGSEKGAPAVMTGSHLDSVSQGGKYDGVVGVVAALEAGRVIVEKKIPHRHPIDLVVFAEEEGSRFGSVLAGSRAWAGKISLADLGGLKDKNGVSYLAALKETNLVPDDESILLPEEVKGAYRTERGFGKQRPFHRSGGSHSRH